MIRDLDDRQTQLINRTRHGHMIVAGQSLYILEVPAGRERRAGGERGGEGRAHQGAGDRLASARSARVYLAGEDRDIDVALPAAERAIQGLSGRAAKS